MTKTSKTIPCPFCNIRMYNVIDEYYPSLETYLCYDCGFHTNTIIIEQKGLYQAYQKLFIHTKKKFGNLLNLKHFHLPPNFKHPNGTPREETEP